MCNYMKISLWHSISKCDLNLKMHFANTLSMHRKKASDLHMKQY